MGIQNTNFRPRMTSRTSGFEPKGDVRWRMLDGVVADIWTVRATEGAGGRYCSPDPRIFVVLDMNAGARLDMFGADDELLLSSTKPGAIVYIPAHREIIVASLGLRRLKHLDLHMTAASLTKRFGGDLPSRARDAFCVLEDDPRVFQLALSLAEECENGNGLHHRYAGGLLDALMTAALNIRAATARARGSLTREQVVTVTDYLERKSSETIRLAELARLVGLSETYLSHAFKAATGLPPLRWQMEARIRAIQERIVQEELSLTEAATLSGFSDQAHFTRAFKSIVGLTPAQWRRSTRSPKT